MSDLKKIVDDHADRLAQKKNVVGVAVGKKWRDGQPSDEDAIIVLVSKKEPLTALKDEDKVEGEIEGVITDVVGKSGHFVKQSYRGKARPVRPGYSCGHPKITAGTVGGFFLDKDDNLVVLSNNHVLANENNARKYDGTRGSGMLQQGPYDGGRHPWRRIGSLLDFVPLRKGSDNHEDSAIGLIIPHTYYNGSVNADIPRIGRVNGWNDNPTMDLKVQKSGRTTGYTTGKIVGLNATIYVGYDMGTVKFVDQILTTDMSKGGDSGSLVLDMNNNIVGLLFAGSSQFTVVNKISYPRTTYGLKIYREPGVNVDSTITIDEEGSSLTSAGSIDTVTTSMKKRVLSEKKTITITEVRTLTYDSGS